MEESLHFYTVIIGTEILNGRRTDRHFDFIKTQLLKAGHTPYCVQVIKDDPLLIASTFEQIKADPKSVMFSFGGIGSTPDDMTRAIAAAVFTAKPLQRHKRFEADIIERFGDEAYPNRIHMADLPEGATLLHNPVNNMSGFALDDRFFFVPGFPQMAHPMISDAITRCFVPGRPKFRKTLLAQTSENTLIPMMQRLKENIELSSLPMLEEGKASVELSVASYEEAATTEAFTTFTDALKKLGIPYCIMP